MFLQTRHLSPLLFFVVVCLALPAGVAAAISGNVEDATTGDPVVGAVVHLQTATSPTVVTDAQGRFVLPVSPEGFVTVTAAVTYAPDASVLYTTGGVRAIDGAHVTISLARIPNSHNADYEPIKAATPGGCGDCHAVQLQQWNGSAHARAATDSWVLDLFSGDGTPGGANGYVYKVENPEGTGFCATCHAPVAEAQAPGTIDLDEVTSVSALEGVNCSSCHQLHDVNEEVQKIHLLGNAEYRFPGTTQAETHEYVWGPLDDITYPFMKASHAPVYSSSRFCASCHEYENPTTGVPAQTTYSEWLESPYAAAGVTCQNCHMPSMGEPGPIAEPPFVTAPTRPAAQRHRHDFVGAIESTLQQAIELEARLGLGGGQLAVEAEVVNLGAGHDFPTGVSIRNAILWVDVTMEGQPLAQISGPVIPFWGSDDDADEDPGDLAGKPGKGFAKILEGEVGGVTTRPVLFIEADAIFSDTKIPSGAIDQTAVRFALPSGAQPGQRVAVEVVLLYRRAFRALAVTKGWAEAPDGGPIEIEVARRSFEIELTSEVLELFADGFESGNAARWSAAST